jgi:uncharacterized membrane protein YdjX (TVP38/TMEM64 family)
MADALTGLAVSPGPLSPAAALGAAVQGAAAPGLPGLGVASWMHALHASLAGAALQPSAGSLALAVALVTVLPLSGVVPMTLICLAVAASLPPLTAAGVILSGVAGNTLIAWSLARTVFGARIEGWLKRRGGWMAALREGARSQPLKWALLSRYAPLPFVAAPMVLSSTGVGLGTTLLGSVLGMLPWTGIYLYVVRAGREDSVDGIGRALGVLVLFYLGLLVLRRRMRTAPADGARGPLKARREGTPLLRLYTLPGQELSDDARAELAGLRDSLGFEVEETSLDADGVRGGELERYRDHAPVALLDGERLFNYQVDRNVLRRRLGRPAQDGE